jgi:hypothetical protein
MTCVLIQKRSQKSSCVLGLCPWEMAGVTRANQERYDSGCMIGSGDQHVLSV